MSDLANLDPLVGRHYVTRSGNVATISRIGKAAIRINWSRWPYSPEDMEEFGEWASSVVGVNLKATVVKATTDEQESEALRQWKSETE